MTKLKISNCDKTKIVHKVKKEEKTIATLAILETLPAASLCAVCRIQVKGADCLVNRLMSLQNDEFPD